MKEKTSNSKHLIMCIMTDVLLFATLLLYFCYFHHVKPMLAAKENPGAIPTEAVIGKPSTTPTNTPTPTEIPEPAISPTDAPTNSPTPTPECDENGVPYDFSGDFGEKFGKMFLGDDRVSADDTSYRSHDLYITMTSFDGSYSQRSSKKSDKPSDSHVVYHVFDIYVRNIENLFCSYKSSRTSFMKLYNDTTIGKTIAAISGDLFYGYDSSKPVIVRNGSVIRKSDYITYDICVLYWDGTLETETHDTYNWDRIKERAPYQIWSFGPSLLDENGAVRDTTSSSVWGKNPRSVIGYVEPGHYVFVAVEGYRAENQKAKNGVGTNLEATAQIAKDFGCKVAYNLDGGASVYAGFQGEQLFYVTNSNETVRNISDIICIGEITGGEK